MDITSEFRSIAATYAAQTELPRRRQHSGDEDDDKPDLFLKEAYKLLDSIRHVQRYLEDTRKAYLSTSKVSYNKHGGGATLSHLTDAQRDEIDYEVQKSIREASLRVKELEELESQQRRRQSHLSHSSTTAARFFSQFLPVDAKEKAGRDLLFTHHASVTWYLNHLLLTISRRHAETKTIRLTREEERMLAVHSKTSTSSSSSYTNTTTTTTPRYAYTETSNAQTSAIETDMAVRETLLSATQLQEFESENTQILQEFESQVSQIKSVQSKLLEIAELSNELQSHLSSQTEMTDRLMTEAEQTTLDVSKGNEQLDAAKRRNKNTRLLFVTIFLTLAFTLLFLDYYSS